jgi:hypothetical protein
VKDASEIVTLATWEDTPRGRPLHQVCSPYVEQCWLPLLGPSTLLFLRFAARSLEISPDGATFDLDDIARCLGLGGRTGDHAPFRRMLSRAVDFRVARIDRPESIAVRRHLPELSARQLTRAPKGAREAHEALNASSGVRSPAAVHAGRLANTLASLGESPSEIERQLLRWRFPPSVAALAAAGTVGRYLVADSVTPTPDPRHTVEEVGLTKASSR